jgi:alkylhydroperoxidase family enzyme
MLERPVKPNIGHLEPPYEPEVEAALTRMMPRGSAIAPLKLFRSFAKNLPFVAAMGPLGGYLLSRGKDGGAQYDLRSRELVIDRVCALCACEYEWGVHIASYAAKAGFDDEQIYSTVHGVANDTCWNDRDRAVLAMVDQLHTSGKFDAAGFAALAEHFEEPCIIELLALAGWYHAIAYLANGMGTELEDWAPRFPDRRT